MTSLVSIYNKSSPIRESAAKGKTLLLLEQILSFKRTLSDKGGEKTIELFPLKTTYFPRDASYISMELVQIFSRETFFSCRISYASLTGKSLL